MSWLTDLGFADKRDSESPIFTRDTREETVTIIRDLVAGSLIPTSDKSTSVSYVFFDYPEDFISTVLKDKDLAFEIERLSESISFIRFIGGCDHRGRPSRNESLEELRELLRNANIPFLTAFEVNGKFEFPRRLMDSAAQYYFCEHGSGSTHHYRPDLKETFRSSWEANVARVLRHKKIPYEYEAHMLPRHDKDGSVTGVYIPDFWLSGNRVIEVKGFWDRDSREKVLEMKKYYPDYKYFIVDQDIYSSLAKLYCDQIPGWETGLHSKIDRLAKQHLDVVGVTFSSRQETVENLAEGDPLVLCRDPDNPYDRDAVLVKTTDGKEVGFLSADWACVLALKLDIGMEYNCAVVSKNQKAVRISAVRSNPDEVILYDFLRE